MDNDQIEKCNGALIQHGPFSNRVYLMKLDGDADRGLVIEHIDRLAKAHAYGKIFVKARIADEPTFLAAGYHREGFVENLFNGTEDGVFLCRYPDPERSHDAREDVINDVINVAKSKAERPFSGGNSPFRMTKATPQDTPEMAELYRTVFDSYPFPVFDPDYLRETMDSHIVYFIARDPAGKLVAASSIEMDIGANNAEMTDFAALPACRGNGIAAHLLATMEQEAPALGIQTLFTIARAMSYGMNATFAKLGYTFGGTLINNTQISGQIESMNIWYKH